MRVFGHNIRRMTMFLCVLEAAIFVAAFFAVAEDLSLFNPGPLAVSVFVEMAVVPAILLFLAMIALGTYNIDILKSPIWVTQRLIAVAVLGGAALIVIIALGISDLLSTEQLLIAEAVAFPLILIGRLGIKHLTAVPGLRSRALVLGTGTHARRVWEALKGDNLGRLHGFVATSSDAGVHPHVPAGRTLTMPQSLSVLAANAGVSQVVLAMDEGDTKLGADVLLECQRQGIAVCDAGTFIEQETGKVDLDGIRSDWPAFTSVNQGGHIGSFCKRALDIVVSGSLLILLAPVLLVVSVLIKLDSTGPIFYRQTRVGLNGTPYNILKFRSMVQDAEKDGKARWASAGDPRVTRIGAILRKSRIDEIPQAINVLKGDMSFVGPRPERPVFVDQLASEIRFFEQRHRVKPGITGWAQINYPYGASLEDAREKLKYDLFYMKHQSVAFDLVIILQTARIVLFAEGAR